MKIDEIGVGMNIEKARGLTSFEKCEFGCYEAKCECCGSEQNRHNAENYKRTSFEYDEGDYACNKCVIRHAENIEKGLVW